MIKEGMKQLLHHFFLPRQSNNHRAKAIHPDMLLLYVLAFAVFNLATRVLSQYYPDILGYATNIHIENLLTETNTKRSQAGLSPLTLNPELSEAAGRKAADMFAKNYWAHVAPDGKTPWDFIIGSGYRYQVAGENLAKNFQDSTGVVDAWMASPSHKDNLLKTSYKEVGFAVVNGKLLGEDTTLVVQMFGTKVGAVAERPTLIPVVSPAHPQPVVVPEVASVTESYPSGFFFPAFAGVLKTPKIDIVALRRDVSMVFAGVLVGIFLVDFYLAMRRRTVRSVGSTVAHVIFLMAILLSMNAVLRGSIL